MYWGERKGVCLGEGRRVGEGVHYILVRGVCSMGRDGGGGVCIN
jgi:hypothetical protein